MNGEAPLGRLPEAPRHRIPKAFYEFRQIGGGSQGALSKGLMDVGDLRRDGYPQPLQRAPLILCVCRRRCWGPDRNKIEPNRANFGGLVLGRMDGHSLFFLFSAVSTPIFLSKYSLLNDYFRFLEIYKIRNIIFDRNLSMHLHRSVFPRFYVILL
jgi:hypothetical protein